MHENRAYNSYSSLYIIRLSPRSFPHRTSALNCIDDESITSGAFLCDSNYTLSSCLLLQNATNEYIYFYTIVTDYNRPLAADITCIDVATHIKVAKFEASSSLTLTAFPKREDQSDMLRDVMKSQ